MAGEIYVAVDSAAVPYEGGMIVLHSGVTRVREGHELLRAHPELFKPIDVHYEVEDGTQRPGARRGGRRSEKSPEDE